MNQMQNEVVQIMLPAQLKNDGNFAGNAAMDIRGAHEACVEIHTGTIDCAIGSTAETEPLKLEECDTEGGSYTDIEDAELAAAIANTKSDKIYRIDIPMDRTRMAFVRVNAPHAGAGSTGANLTIIGRKAKLENGPANATERGLEEHIIP